MEGGNICDSILWKNNQWKHTWELEDQFSLLFGNEYEQRQHTWMSFQRDYGKAQNLGKI